ncbi:peptidoglycan D,D-transpeptidase FtsI family protein [Nocardioides daejeonensis]|uniref:peptidoglycan D,D-transpeptidase FtsI family protein n=1 Tax=Nocardioides daejeonensis TaxID=1046556 RepID=UPI000D744BE1|nr:penicillin-binding transpeptidase domain-containing protein [Nocardioides daejeonensis]
MNKPIRTMSLFCMLLLLLLLGNVTYLQYIKAEDYNDNPLNARVKVETLSRERGSILVNGRKIAESIESDDRYKFQRVYLQPFMYAPITGYFALVRSTLLERSQNKLLNGDDNRLFVTRLVDLVNNASPKGGSIELTINAKAQKAAYDGLLALGDDVQGGAVAIEPDTGKILAMVSLPSYNPNKYADHDQTAVDAYDKALQTRADKPRLSRATQVTLPPGSTFKLVTAAAAMEAEGYRSDSLVPGGSSYRLPGTRLSINNGGRACGTDQIPLVQALEQSCNTTFLALANQVGQDKMLAQAEKFGFNSTLLDEFDDSEQAPSAYPTEEISDDFLAKTGMGQQDVRATPLQMAMVVAGIFNDGIVMKPYLVDKVRSADLDLLESTDPAEYSRAVSSDTASELRKMMVSVVDRGTGSVGAIPGVEVGAKTGTAENCAGCQNYSWFVSFASSGGKDVAVAVMVQKSDADYVSGSGQAGPIARAIMEAVVK